MTVPPRRPTPRVARWLKWATIPAALGVSALIVAQSSYAAFSATTSNPTNNWTAGTVALSDDDANSAMFTVTGLKPGSTGQKCIVVTSTGNLPSTVKLYGTNAATTNALSASINLTVVQGTGGSFSGGCTGFTPQATNSSVYSGTLAAFGSAATNFASGFPTAGAATWAPTGTGSESRTYQFNYTLDANAPNTVQGGTAAMGFTWEAQNS